MTEIIVSIIITSAAWLLIVLLVFLIGVNLGYALKINEKLLTKFEKYEKDKREKDKTTY